MPNNSIGKGKVRLAGPVVTPEQKEKLELLARQSGVKPGFYVNALIMAALENNTLVFWKLVPKMEKQVTGSRTRQPTK